MINNTREVKINDLRPGDEVVSLFMRDAKHRAMGVFQTWTVDFVGAWEPATAEHPVAMSRVYFRHGHVARVTQHSTFEVLAR